MTSLNPVQDINAATADLHALVDSFKAKWLTGHAANPEHYPLVMSEGDWFDQFLSGCSTA